MSTGEGGHDKVLTSLLFLYGMWVASLLPRAVMTSPGQHSKAVRVTFCLSGLHNHG